MTPQPEATISLASKSRKRNGPFQARLDEPESRGNPHFLGPLIF